MTTAIETTAWVNGRRLEQDLGLRFETTPAFLGAPSMARDSVALFGAHGAIPSPVATTEPRQWVCGMFAETASDAAEQALIDRAQEAVIGLQELVLAHAPDRLIRCLVTRNDGERVGPASFLSRGMRASWTFTAFDAARYDRSPRPTYLRGTPTPIGVGTLDSGGLLKLFDVVAETTFTVRNLAGTIVGFLTLTGDTPVGGYWELDFWHQTIDIADDEGARTNGANLVTAGDWFPFVAGDADREFGAFQTGELSDDARGILYLRRRWP